MPETLIAHCGAGADLMILVSEADAHWFICLACGESTDPRPTVAEAAEDVVWSRRSKPRP